MRSERQEAEKLGELLKELREERGLKQIEVIAEIGGLTETQLSNYERGRTDPGTEMIIKFCKYYQVSADYLLGLSRYRQHITFDTDISRCSLVECSSCLRQLTDFQRRLSDRIDQLTKRPVRGNSSGAKRK